MREAAVWPSRLRPLEINACPVQRFARLPLTEGEAPFPHPPGRGDIKPPERLIGGHASRTVSLSLI